MNKFRFSLVSSSIGLLLSVLSGYAVAAPTAITCGGLISGTITAPGQVNQYAYSGQAGGMITLTLAGFNSGYPNYAVPHAVVYDPNGNQVLSFNANSQQQVTLNLTGPYLIQISASDLVDTGSYDLGLVCRNPLQPATALSCGSLDSGKIGSAAQVDQYTFCRTGGRDDHAHSGGLQFGVSELCRSYCGPVRS